MQQRFGILQIRRVKSFGEPMVDRCQEVMGFVAFALLVPESSEAGGSTEFPGLCLLVLGYRNGMVKASFRFNLIVQILL